MSEAAKHRQQIFIKGGGALPGKGLSIVTVPGDDDPMTVAQLAGWESYEKMINRAALRLKQS